MVIIQVATRIPIDTLVSKVSQNLLATDFGLGHCAYTSHFSSHKPGISSFRSGSDIVADRSVVSLLDPLSRTRIEVPARSNRCRHISVRFWIVSLPAYSIVFRSQVISYDERENSEMGMSGVLPVQPL